jgi:predicted alpha/beta-fold hydrolase
MVLFGSKQLHNDQLPIDHSLEQEALKFLQRVDSVQEISRLPSIWYEDHPNNTHKTLDELSDEIQAGLYSNPISPLSKHGKLRELAHHVETQRRVAETLFPHRYSPIRLLLLIFGAYRLLIQIFRIPVIITLLYWASSLQMQSPTVLTPVNNTTSLAQITLALLLPIFLYLFAFYQSYILLFKDEVFARAVYNWKSKVTNGTYVHPLDTQSNKILQDKQLSTLLNRPEIYPFGWYNADLQTLLPTICHEFADFKVPYIRRFVKNPYDNESIAMDISFPSRINQSQSTDSTNPSPTQQTPISPRQITTNTSSLNTLPNNYQSTSSSPNTPLTELYHDPTKPILILTHGLNGSSLASYIQSHVNYYNMKGHTCICVNSRGYGNTFSLYQPFVSSRSSDFELGVRFAHIGAGNNTINDLHIHTRRSPHATTQTEPQLLSLKTCFKNANCPMDITALHLIRTPLCAAGFSLGGCTVAHYVARYGKHTGLAAAFAAGAIGERLTNNPQSERDWEPFLMDTVKSFVGNSEPLLYAPQVGNITGNKSTTHYIDINGLMMSTSIREFDKYFSSQVHGVDTIEEFDSYLAFATEKKLQNIKTKLFIIHPENDPILGVDGLWSATQSLKHENDQDDEFKSIRNQYYKKSVKNLIIHIPKYGGHLGPTPSVNDKWTYLAEVSHAFSMAAVAEAQSAKEKSSSSSMTSSSTSSSTTGSSGWNGGSRASLNQPKLSYASSYSPLSEGKTSSNVSKRSLNNKNINITTTLRGPTNSKNSGRSQLSGGSGEGKQHVPRQSQNSTLSRSSSLSIGSGSGTELERNFHEDTFVNNLQSGGDSNNNNNPFFQISVQNNQNHTTIFSKSKTSSTPQQERRSSPQYPPEHPYASAIHFDHDYNYNNENNTQNFAYTHNNTHNNTQNTTLFRHNHHATHKEYVLSEQSRENHHNALDGYHNSKSTIFSALVNKGGRSSSGNELEDKKPN